MTDQQADKLVLGLDEVADMLSIGRTLTNQLVREGQIRSIKIGHRRLVARADLELYIDELRSGEAA
jgi:excisionase family DNA binding protein